MTKPHGFQETFTDLYRSYIDKVLYYFFTSFAHDIRRHARILSLHLLELQEMPQIRLSSRLGRELITLQKEVFDLQNSFASNLPRFKSFETKYETEECDIYMVLERLIGILNTFLISRSCKVQIERLSTDAMILMDQSVLQVISFALIMNSVEANSTWLAIRVKHDRVDRRRSEKCDISIEFIDNGSGIPKSSQHDIFYLEYTSKHSPFGLGLFIARKLAQWYDGNLFLKESKPNRGSTFVLSLPAHKGFKN